MSLLLRRGRVKVIVPKTWMGRMKARAVATTDKVVPMASSARDSAVHRIEDARLWAAPKLDHAAHTVEDQLAPRVSAILAEAARRVEPASARSRRRWPMLVLLGGLALGALGFVMYRKNTQQWSDTMHDVKNQVKGGVAEAKRAVSDATHRAEDKAEELGDKAEAKADEISGKLS